MSISPNERYVAYLFLPMQKGSAHHFMSHQSLNLQQNRVQHFLKEHPNAVLLKTFIETGESQRHRWPELEAAISYCLTHQAHLILGEIRNLTNNNAFTKQILRLIEQEIGEIHCCDQPFIKNDNFPALVEYAKQQKKLHGELIKAGLSRTTAKSGNPHASDVISKVNKSKIDNAILFSLLLQPIISDYRSQGFSQRKMVNALNEEGFTAPEGGHWVLSQLQKVLDRIKFNETALSLEKKLKEYRENHLDNAGIAEILNRLEIPSPKNKEWNGETVEKIFERIDQIHDIIHFNEFLVALIPILDKYHVDELTEEVFSHEIMTSGIPLPSMHVQDSL